VSICCRGILMKSRCTRQFALTACAYLVSLGLASASAAMSWEWERPLPLGGSRVFAIWGTSPTDVWYGGEEGTLLHFDGTDWVRHDVGQAVVVQFSGISSSDLWFVGSLVPYQSPNAAFHWDGENWTRTDIPGVGGMSCVLELAPDDVFAGGNSGLYRWNGSTWSAVPGWYGYVTSIWGTSPDDLWVNGIHWDGSVWERRGFVSVVTGTAPDDAWGHAGSGIYHWDGQSWTLSLPAEQIEWVSIKAFARDDVWAFQKNRSVHHFDGNGWTEVTPPDGAYPDWFAMWMESPSYAVSASPQGAIREWDGSRWTTDEENRNHLVALSGAGDSLWAVGSYGTILRRRDEVWREEPSGTRAHLRLVLATSADDAWAAGSERTLLHWNGNAWRPAIHPSEHDFVALFGSDPNDVSAVSRAAELFTWNGSTWTLASIAPVDYEALGASGSSSRNVWIPQPGPPCIQEWCHVYLWHWDGDRWERSIIGGYRFSLGAAWSSSGDDLWIEETSSLMHWDGSTWTRYPNNHWGSGFWGDRPDNLWYFGWGVLRHWDGSQWTNVGMPTRQYIGGLWQSGNRVWLGGANGMVLRGEQEPAARVSLQR
jgi:hypothetical protein